MSDKRKICILLCSLGALTLLCTLTHMGSIKTSAIGAGSIGTMAVNVLDSNISENINDLEANGSALVDGVKGNISGVTSNVEGAVSSVEGHISNSIDGVGNAIANGVANVESNISQEAQAVQADMAKVLSFENIRFETNRADIVPESLVSVEKIAKILSENPNVKVEIGGHTDDLGNDNYNKNLSQQRVDAVKAKLKELGIASERVSAVGYGETKPLVQNSSDDNRKQNRRVEFKIVGE